MMCPYRQIWSLLALLLGSGQLAAQEMRLIPDEVQCPSCRITLTRLLDVGASDGPGMLDWRGGQAMAALDSRDHIYLRGFFSKQIKLYAADGNFVATLGREGEGPGEFKGINGLVIGPGDSLYVLDALSMRLSVFSPDHKFVRSAPIEVQPTGYDPITVSWDPDHFYLTSHMRTAELIGWPIHRMDLSGARSHSFGSATGDYSPSQPYSGLRIIADAGDGQLWSARLERYLIQLVAPQRGQLGGIRREADWFPDPRPEDLAVHDDATRPPPMIADLWQDGSHLWVLSWLPDPKWEAAGTELENEYLRYDTMIELIDLESYRVVTRMRVDELYQEFLGNGRMGGTVFRGGYVPIYRIMRMSVVGLGKYGRHGGWGRR